MCDWEPYYDPSVWYGELIDAPQETEQTAPDPYDRPDFAAQWPEEDDGEEPDCDPVTGLPLTSCAVCGLRTIPEGATAYPCPVCGWQVDAGLCDLWEPSAYNHGLSLYEAQLNFRTFGWSDPAMLIEGEEKNDAEF